MSTGDSATGDKKKVEDAINNGTNNLKRVELSYVEFNQDNTCFIYTFNNEFCVWHCDSLDVRYNKLFKKNLGRATVLYKTNIVALSTPTDIEDALFYPISVHIWDDYNNRIIGHLDFTEPVLAVKVTRKRIIAVLKNNVVMHDLNNLKMLDEFTTCDNPKGLCVISDLDVLNQKSQSTTPDRTVIAFPGEEPGDVQIYDISTAKVVMIKAHEGRLENMALDRSGMMLATASEKGTLVKVFSTVDGSLLYQLRRGTVPKRINNLSFNATSDLLCVTSQGQTDPSSASGSGNGSGSNSSNMGGTVHVYHLDESKSNKYWLQSMGFSGLDYSDTKFYLKDIKGNFICGFDDKTNNLIVVSYDGTCYRYVQVKKNETLTVAALNTKAPNAEEIREVTYNLKESVRLIPKLN